MGLKKIQIVFDNPWSTYYSGQAVTGKLFISVDSPKKIRGIVIHFKGEAYVKWDESESRKNDDGTESNVTVERTGQEQYFENKYNLVGGGSGEMTLQQGDHVYPFTTHLPPNLPSSFEGEYGYIRYTVKATLDRPWKFDQEVKSAFTVLTPLDLNTHETAKNPVKLEKEKFLCCLCCKSGPLSLVLSLPASGYVPGQDIPITIEMDNNSTTNITNVSCLLRKKLIFHVTTPSRQTKKDSVTIGEMKLEPVAAGGSKVWADVIKVPPLPPSNLTGCNIINLEYDLKVVATVSGPHRNLELKTPIILGTIPLLAFQKSGAVPSQPAMLNNGGGDAGTGGVPLDNAGNTAPTGWSFPSDPAQVPLLPPAGEPSRPQPNIVVPQPGMGYPQQPSPQPGMGYPQQPSPQPGMGYPQQPSPQPGMGYPQQPSPLPSPNLSGRYPQQPFPSPQQPGNQPQSPGNQSLQPGFQPSPIAPPSQPGAPIQPSAPASLYPTIPQPTFEQSGYKTSSIQDAGDNKYTQGMQQFAPMYPVYNIPAPGK